MMKTIEKPNYEHHCGYCRYLGSHEHEGELFDLYSCVHNQTEGGLPRISARFASESNSYFSGFVIDESLVKLMYADDKNHPLAEATRRHFEQMKEQ